LGDAHQRFPGGASKLNQFTKGDLSPVLYAEELNYLNSNWRPWAVRAELSTHRGFIGKQALKAKEYLLHLVWDIFFAEYFRREEEYQRQLVRYLNKVARYIDARDAELFWQLVGKVDSDIEMANDKSDRLYDELAVSIQRLESRLDSMSAKNSNS
ncbi:unnamed protein product, partial [marine sediment metagenome]